VPDPVFLITGASSGIGAATARHAAEAGYRLVLAARSEEKLAALAEELGGPGRALAVRCDVTEWNDQEAMVAAAIEACSANGSAEERSTSPRTEMPLAVLSSPQVLGMISGTVYTDAADGRKLFPQRTKP